MQRLSLAKFLFPSNAGRSIPAPEEPDSGVENLTIPEIKQLLDDLGIDYPSGALKADLIDLLTTEGG